MKVRDLIARLSALRVAGLLDEWGEELVGTLERQAARGQGPTERQRFATIALLKRARRAGPRTLPTGLRPPIRPTRCGRIRRPAPRRPSNNGEAGCLSTLWLEAHSGAQTGRVPFN